MHHQPHLGRVERDHVPVLTDQGLRASHGIVVAFSERSGGAGEAPYDSLNLAAHVGDVPTTVDENRSRLMAALGIAELRGALATAEQVHGAHVEVVDEGDAGRGAYAASGDAPIAGTDALVTRAVQLPMLMFYADCVPLILVHPGRPRGISVVHAGWRGALDRIPGKAAIALAEECGAAPSDLIAYIGPHIASCCYDIDEERMSQFDNAFDTIAAADGHLDLSSAARESLAGTGVNPESIVEAELCTHDHVDRFFSFRAAPTTGRHGALAVIIRE
jgi:YfiH family protein